MTKFYKTTIIPWFLGHKGINLVLIKHPTAGYQLPGGSVEVDEDINEAAKRELFEETGLDAINLQLIRKEILDDKYLLSKISTNLFTLCRGLPVKISKNIKNSDITVIYEEFDYNSTPKKFLFSIETISKKSDISDGCERYFFSSQVKPPSDKTWKINADSKIFIIETYDLENVPKLLEPHDTWLMDSLDFIKTIAV